MKLNHKISQFIDIIKDSNIPGLIMSTPGMGKTSTLEAYCKYHNYQLVQLIASQYSADDILGIQSVDNGRLKRLTPAWYDNLIDNASGRRTLLFIDEITTCDEFIQAPLLNLIFNKSLGDKSLPEGTIIVAAGNYSECLNNAVNLSAPLVNRFMILNLKSDDVDLNELLTDPISEWKDYQLRSKLYDNSTDILSESNLTTLKNIIINYSDLSKCEFENSIKYGLIGFQSVRSIHYSIKFMMAANKLGMMNRYSAKVISDTLGQLSSGNYFIKYYRSIESQEIGLNISKDLSRSELVEVLNHYCNNPMDLSDCNFSIIREVAKNYEDDIEVKYLFAKLNSSIS